MAAHQNRTNPTHPRQDRESTATPPEHTDLIDIDEALAALKTTRSTLYRWLREGRFKGVKVGRKWRFERREIDRFLKGETPRIDLPSSIHALLRTLRDRFKATTIKLAASQSTDLLQQVVDLTIALAAGLRASDIHMTPHVQPQGAEPAAVLRYRVDGVLHPVASFDLRLLAVLIDQWKRIGTCNVQDKQKVQDCVIKRDLAALSESLKGKSLDLRVCFVPTALGESLTIRVLDSAAAPFDLARIEYAPRDLERLRRALKLPWGLIVVTGPTGCGKTTSLYACLLELARPQLKIMTIEDPVEYLLPWVTQIQTNEAAGLTLARAARACFHCAADVIFLSEIRDLETLSIAQQAALTGHLVLTTMHTNDAAQVLVRMVEMGSDPFVVADAVKLIVAQRLIRKLCQHCSEKAQPEPQRLERAAELARKGGVGWDSLQLNFKKAVGCEKCAGTGYRGRNVAAEVLEVTPEITRALRDNASADTLRTIAVGQGMTTMAADGIRRAAAGDTTLDEVFRVLG